MALRIAEYACGPMSGRIQTPGNIAFGNSVGGSTALVGPIQAQFSTGISTGATPAFTLSAQTRAVMIDTDQGALLCFGSSVSTQPTVTSTNGQHIPVNVAPILFYVQPGQKIFAAST